MGPQGFPPLMPHEPIFQILAQSIEEIKSYWSCKQGFKLGH